jgi:multicomponent Na+:H+ antiporter subunit D
VTAEHSMLLSLALPTLGALGVAATGRAPNLREAVTLTVSLATALVVATLLPGVMAGARPDVVLAEPVAGVPLALRLEPLGALYAMVASGLWTVTSLYAIGYMRGHHETHQTRFFVCFALAISAALGVAYAANLFTLFLFYELLTLSTYPLVTHAGTDEARRAGRVYLGILLSTSVGLLLFGILWTHRVAGTTEFSPGGILAGKVDGGAAMVLLGLFAFGTGKAALMPIHRWLPSAMVAPTPVSALLHAVAVVKAGVFTILKVVIYVFGIDFLSSTGASLWLGYVASFTIIVGSLVAFTKDNLKARLAYSTVSQLAYIVLGAAVATRASVAGGGLHIAVHAVSKITLFFCAGAILVGAHKSKVSELDGLGRRMPFTMAAFLVGSLSIAGLPPLAGAWSKWYLVLGAAEGHQLVFIAVLMLSSLLSLGYLVPVAARAFFLPLPGGDAHERGGISEAPLLCVIPPLLTAAGCIALFFLADPVVRFVEQIVGGSP